MKYILIFLFDRTRGQCPQRSGDDDERSGDDDERERERHGKVIDRHSSINTPSLKTATFPFNDVDIIQIRDRSI